MQTVYGELVFLEKLRVFPLCNSSWIPIRLLKTIILLMLNLVPKRFPTGVIRYYLQTDWKGFDWDAMTWSPIVGHLCFLSIKISQTRWLLIETIIYNTPEIVCFICISSVSTVQRLFCSNHVKLKTHSFQESSAQTTSAWMVHLFRIVLTKQNFLSCKIHCYKGSDSSPCLKISPGKRKRPWAKSEDCGSERCPVNQNFNPQHVGVCRQSHDHRTV